MIIVGAGSAGLFFAEKYLREHSGKAIVLEEHKELGLPVQCTGILTNEIESMIRKNDLRKFELNRITKTRIFSSGSNSSFAELNIQPNIIIDNQKFVEYLADMASKQGADIRTGQRYISNNGEQIKIRNLGTGRVISLKDKFLVGADGPQSQVAKLNALNKKRKYLLGIQARIRLKSPPENRVDFFPSVGEYAWCVPENEEIARVGVALPLMPKNYSLQGNKFFEDFAKQFSGKRIDMQSGLIPLYSPGKKIFVHSRGFSAALLGDAASQIKNTTGGGIIPGLKAAEILAQNPMNYYSKTGKLRRELYLHYLLCKALRNYNSSDWKRLINKAKQDSVADVLSEVNRDNAGKLLFSLATKKGMLSEAAIAMRKILS